MSDFDLDKITGNESPIEIEECENCVTLIKEDLRKEMEAE